MTRQRSNRIPGRRASRTPGPRSAGLGTRLATFVAATLVLAGPAAAAKPAEEKNDQVRVPPGFCPVTDYSAVKHSVQVQITDTAGTIETAPIEFAPQAGTVITDVVVGLDIAHTWSGDLVIQLAHTSSTGETKTVDLLHRPGAPAETFGCSGDLVSDPDNKYYFGSATESLGETDCPSALPGGCYAVAPENATGLETFRGQPLGDGQWVLRVTDNAPGDDGWLYDWAVYLLGTPPALSVQEKSWGELKSGYR